MSESWFTAISSRGNKKKKKRKKRERDSPSLRVPCRELEWDERKGEREKQVQKLHPGWLDMQDEGWSKDATWPHHSAFVLSSTVLRTGKHLLSSIAWLREPSFGQRISETFSYARNTLEPATSRKSCISLESCEPNAPSLWIRSPSCGPFYAWRNVFGTTILSFRRNCFRITFAYIVLYDLRVFEFRKNFTRQRISFY